MTKDELRQAIISITISEMEKINGPGLSIADSNKLFKGIKKDLDEMTEKWWSNHFPWCHYTLSVQRVLKGDPRVIINWTHDGNQDDNWRRLEFAFNPVQVISDNDPIIAYDRAMAII